ncbi:N-acetyltransferase family protein [Asanoa sp. NPDC049573]|uniref:GNAT family N-acetyltransferase n=1 Tax=Asanoa sp. NPDC049573 TaxID=3155396 RepID=UPI003448F6E5
MSATIRPMTSVDWPAARRIYQDGLDTGLASFETEAPEWPAFDGSRLPSHRFVALLNGAIVGWVAVSRVSTRAAYAGVVEHSVYVDPAARGNGVGSSLLGALIASTEEAGIWTIQSGVFPANIASLRLHAAAGFRVVGTRERVARRDGEWRDVVLVERRSKVVN